MSEFDFAQLGLYLLVVLMMVCYLIWVGFIRDFIRRAGGKPGFVAFNWVLISDYLKARAIAKRIGRVPWFLRLYEVVMAVALLSGVGIAVCMFLLLG